jgi:alpha-1,2-mannosyltransferase
VAAGALLALYLFRIPGTGWHLIGYRLDLDVYRLGAQVWLHGGPLYGTFPPTRVGTALPFTYPPLAAVEFSPLVVVPLGFDSVLVTVVSVALIGVVGAVVIHAQGRTPDLWWVVTIIATALALEPIRATLSFGQIDLLLLAAVVADCLLERPAMAPRAARRTRRRDQADTRGRTGVLPGTR